MLAERLWIMMTLWIAGPPASCSAKKAAARDTGPEHQLRAQRLRREGVPDLQAARLAAVPLLLEAARGGLVRRRVVVPLLPGREKRRGRVQVVNRRSF